MNYVAIPGLKFKGSFEDMMAMTEASPGKDKIINAVLRHYGVRWSDLLVRSRKYNVVVPRQIIMHLLHEWLGMGCAEIAALFNQDHTTALHSFKRVKDLLETDINLRNTVRGIKENIL